MYVFRLLNTYIKKHLFSYWLSVWISLLWCRWGTRVLCFYLITISFCLNTVFRCSYIGCIYIYTCYIFWLDWFLYYNVMAFFVSCYSLSFKVCFVWYKYCCLSFLFVLHRISFSIPSLSSTFGLIEINSLICTITS